MASTAVTARPSILALAQSGPPRALVAPAIYFLRASPDDAGVRYLLARALHAEGFSDEAHRHLSLLPPAARADERVAQLAAAVGPTSRSTMLDPAEIPARLARALTILTARGVVLPAAFVALCTAEAARIARTERWHVAPSGTLLRLNAAGDAVLNAAHLRADIPALITAALGTTRPEDLGPILLDGLAHPGVLAELIARTPPTDNGYAPRIRIVEPDAAALTCFLAAVGATPAPLASPRLTWHLGPAALDQFAADLAASTHAQLSGPIVSNTDAPSSDTPAGPAPSPAVLVLQRALASQEALVRDAAGRAARAPRRDAAFWAARFAAPGPRRVLIPSCRFSTFIRHSAEDLASALRAAGHEARVLIEPDAHTRLSRLAYQHALAEFDPDLVIAINFPRASLGRLFPDDLPFVCWVQDAMPHLFRSDIGRSQSDLDFLTGHSFDALFRRFGYPRSRFLYSPVTVHAPKFARPADHPAVPRTCELAFVTNHAEPPDAMHARLCAEAAQGADAAIVRVFELLRPGVLHAIDHLRTHAAEPALRAAAADAARTALGTEPQPALIDQLVAQYAAPMAERVVRHQTIDWAISIALRRGWRFRLSGRGWDRSPRHAPFAAGPAEHGPALRDAYSSAALQLHASIHANAHQRLAECALSGGLMGVRLARAMLGDAEHAAAADGITLDCTVEHWAPPAPGRTWSVSRLRDRVPGIDLVSGPHLLARTALLQRLGIHDPTIEDGFAYVCRRRVMAMATDSPAGWHDFTISRLLGDLAEVAFSSEAELEALAERAITRPAWREATVRSTRARAADAFTTDAFVARLLTAVSTSLNTLAARRSSRPDATAPLTPHAGPSLAKPAA